MRRKRRMQLYKLLLLGGLVCLIVVLGRMVRIERELVREIREREAQLMIQQTVGSGSRQDVEATGDNEMSIDEMRKYIKKHPELYPEELRELAAKNEEAVEYVYNYPALADEIFPVDLSEEASSETVPLLLQWDRRWGYCTYGSGLIGYTGCGPTCLSMVSLFLTDNEKYTPQYIAEYAQREGYYVQGSGTTWDLMSSGCKKFGLKATELAADENVVKAALDKGHPVICAMRKGDFTDSGHFIVIAGYDREGLRINDPNSRERSEKHWEFDKIKYQIRNLWAFERK